jgi:hypothetical protein
MNSIHGGGGKVPDDESVGGVFMIIGKKYK